MRVSFFALLALAAGVVAHEAAPPQPRTNAEALARGMAPLDPRHWGNDKGGNGRGKGNKPKPSPKPKPTQAGPNPDFTKTCDWYDIDFSSPSKPMLRAKCRNNRGNLEFSDLNLNKCLSHRNGKLVCTPGGFTGTSRRRDLGPDQVLDERHWGNDDRNDRDRNDRDRNDRDRYDDDRNDRNNNRWGHNKGGNNRGHNNKGGNYRGNNRGKDRNDRDNKDCTRCETTGDDGIECSCPLNRGGRVDATYNLGDCISNVNGRLVCKDLD